MRTAVITVGRNIGHTPMDDERWHQLLDYLWDEVTLYGTGMFIGTGTGAGEEAATLILDRVNEWDDYVKAELRIELGQVAERFGQECIALTFGDVQFVGPGGGLVTWN
jgi:hypothetical protein